MFYADFLFVKRGPLSKVWQMAHLSKKLSRRDAASTNVITAVHAIEQPAAPLALRSQGQLLLGLVRIYDGQVRYLQADCTEAAAKLDSVMERGRGAAAGRRGDVDVDAKDIIASAGAITVSEREAQQGLGLYDGYDALEEQRYLEDHARQLTAYSQDPAAPYPSLSLSLSQSQSSPQQQQQQQQRLSQAADLSLEQARRATQSFHTALDDFELGEGMALEDDIALLEGAAAAQAAGGVEPMELELARDDAAEMRRESGRDDGADILGLDADRRVSVISAAGAVDETAEERQRAADVELIKRREARRQDRKRLRFASAVRDEVNEIDAQEMKAMIADTTDIVRNRESSSLLNPRRRRERLIRGEDGVSSLLHTAMAGSLGEERVDRLLAELFSAEGVRTAERAEAAGAESTQAAAVEPQDVSYLDPADIVGGDFNVGLQDEVDMNSYQQQQQQPPASPHAQPPSSPASAAASAVPPPPTESDLLASAQSDRLSSLTTRSFFDEAASASPVPEEEKEAVGFTSRTRKVLTLLRQAHGGPADDRALDFDSLALQGARGGRVSRGVAAGLFYQMLVLAQAGAVRCEQQAAYEEITITRGHAFDDVAGRLGAARVGAIG